MNLNIKLALAMLAPAVAIFVGAMSLHGPGARLGGARGGRGIDLKNLWGDENESARRRAFSWLTRTGAGRRFPGMPIGWYQQHQIAAIDALVDRAKARGVSDPQMFKAQDGQFSVRSGGRWVDLALDARQLFDIADRKARGS